MQFIFWLGQLTQALCKTTCPLQTILEFLLFISNKTILLGIWLWLQAVDCFIQLLCQAFYLFWNTLLLSTGACWSAIWKPQGNVCHCLLTHIFRMQIHWPVTEKPRKDGDTDPPIKASPHLSCTLLHLLCIMRVCCLKHKWHEL